MYSIPQRRIEPILKKTNVDSTLMKSSETINCYRAVLTLSQGHFNFSYCPAREKAGGPQGAGRVKSSQRDVSYHKASCSAIKEEWEDIWRDGVCLPKKPLHIMGLALQGVADHLPGDGK